MENFFENEFIQGWFENGIMITEYKVTKLDLPSAKECVKLRLSVNVDHPYPFLADARKVQNITKDARDYLASDEGIKRVTASAIIIDSMVGKVMGNFFLQINKPKVPLKIFNNITDAVAWLKQFKLTVQG